MVFELPSAVFSSQVFHGDQEGRKIGFPTLNFDAAVVPPETKQGVYTADLIIATTPYLGALYYGPRTIHDQEKIVLEVFVLDFNQEVYGQTVQFSLRQFIRPVLKFSSLSELKKQLQLDVEAVRAVKK